MAKINLAIFASGRGSNADAIIKYFSDRDDVAISLILSNKSIAGVLQLAKKNDISSIVFNKISWQRHPSHLTSILNAYKIDYIVLAGYLWLIPQYLIESFPNRIINIHPALLPKYGGKGMYGQHIHEAISQQGDSISGMTVHLVSKKYDEGEILFQKSINIEPHSAAEDIASAVLRLEHKYYPEIIDKWIKSNLKN